MLEVIELYCPLILSLAIRLKQYRCICEIWYEATCDTWRLYVYLATFEYKH